MPGGTGLTKPLILWINDGLMAVFIFLIGLELQRELREGKLRCPSDILLPGMAALGGMVAPALIHLGFNASGAAWGRAIPTATDIACALGVLALVGRGLPPGLQTFLLTLAILDDLGAFLIIALFYTDQLNLTCLAQALIPLAGLAALNRAGSARVAPALLPGVVLWVLVLKSGVHATLAGVVTAFSFRRKTAGAALHFTFWEWVCCPMSPLGSCPCLPLPMRGLTLAACRWPQWPRP